VKARVEEARIAQEARAKYVFMLRQQSLRERAPLRDIVRFASARSRGRSSFRLQLRAARVPRHTAALHFVHPSASGYREF
jgi:hypothetical protein